MTISISQTLEQLAKVFDKEDLHTRTEQELMLLARTASHILRAKVGERTYDVRTDKFTTWSD